jgi:hypothetical protein
MYANAPKPVCAILLTFAICGLFDRGGMPNSRKFQTAQIELLFAVCSSILRESEIRPYSFLYLAIRNRPTLMDKAKILAAAKSELCRHSWTTFVDEPPARLVFGPLRRKERSSVISSASPRLQGQDRGRQPSPSTIAFPAPTRRLQNASAVRAHPHFPSIPQNR